ncbi:zinc-binding dehydrogenase [Neobacillus rhizophilus]|uniref:Zinc-binding dehydrogenase n=1 Tax=Neobacillus rhizophilus TaxID=2833579 RepID=A0A942YSH2_9BACI|nr:zinc-binding dehydrogenase [Neobacillus rhizophilus]MBS4210867.1 zinc-binding dehydrogenase [Neobacillus rhizophilus]
MKAVILRDLGGPEQYRIGDVDIPSLGEDEVLVRIRAAAFNRRDIFIRKGEYPGIRLPAIPGADGAGEIAAVGKGVKDLAIGDKVVINPALNWGNDERIYTKDFSIVGVPTNGTFAEYINVPRENVFPKPEHLSWEEAAALPLGGLTAYRALLTKGKVKKGEAVLIPGIGGGVATFLLQMAVALGTNVFVTSSSEEKIQKAISLGASGGVNYKEPNWEKQLRKWMPEGADLCIDSVGGDNFVKLLNIAKHGSRIVTFGATACPVPQLVMPKIFLKQIDVIGTTMGSPAEFQSMLSFYDKHKIKPVIDSVFSIEEIREAQLRIEKGVNFGKVVVIMPWHEL